MGLQISIKAQVWYIDFVIAIAIFTVAFVIFINASSDILDRENDEFSIIADDSGRISNMLMTKGYPENWDNNTVQILGIMEKNRVNETKLLMAANTSYDKARTLFATKYEYFVFFKDKDDNVLNLGGFCGFGSPLQIQIISERYCANFTVNSGKIAQAERLAIYKSQVARMVTYVWK